MPPELTPHEWTMLLGFERLEQPFRLKDAARIYGGSISPELESIIGRLREVDALRGAASRYYVNVEYLARFAGTSSDVTIDRSLTSALEWSCGGSALEADRCRRSERCRGAVPLRKSPPEEGEGVRRLRHGTALDFVDSAQSSGLPDVGAERVPSWPGGLREVDGKTLSSACPDGDGGQVLFSFSAPSEALPLDDSGSVACGQQPGLLALEGEPRIERKKQPSRSGHPSHAPAPERSGAAPFSLSGGRDARSRQR